MKRREWVGLILGLLTTTLASSQERRPPPDFPPRGDVTIRDLSFRSESLGRPMSFIVILPPGYEESSRRYPTLYLLHGLTGSYRDWEARTNLAAYARRYDLILVLPDGNDSWYANSAGEPQEKYEDYIAKDLLSHVETNYRAIRSRHSRAIAGLSMGGYGALKFGIKYPGTYSFAGSFSGALQVARDAGFLAERPGPFRDAVLKIFGDAGSEARSQNDIYGLIAKADPSRMPYFYIDCGTEDGLLKANREFAALLQERKIPYEYRELPGAHTWDYWDRQVQALLEVLAQRMNIRRAR